MQLHLKKPLAFFDLETTGVNVTADRIVEIGIVIMHVDGSKTEHRYLVNPTIPIPIESSLIHGIYDKDVVDSPSFAELSDELFELLNPCDLGGFNSNRFDVPILVEEFLRVEKNFSIDNRNLIDVRNIFVMMEKRDLTSAYKFFCGKDLENAHSALADVVATHEVFLAQVERYDELSNFPLHTKQKLKEIKLSLQL